MSNAVILSHILTTSEMDAFLLEANLIKKLKPFYNIKFSDDKFFPYIKISKGDVPYITVTRKMDDKTSFYFGPYPSVESVKIVLKLVRRIFPYQSVRLHPKKACFYYHIHLCLCVNFFPQNKIIYKKNVSEIRTFLRGEKDILLKQLERERSAFAKQLEFESAILIQKKIDAISTIFSQEYDPFSYISDPAFYQDRMDREKKSLINILSDYYPKLSSLKRVECYDISNIQGKNATGSMVVFTNGEADKASYRRFKIRLKSSPDDFSMMQEMLYRRIKRDDWEMPDLMVIDGGKGQVSSVLEILAASNLNIPVIGLAKKEEIIVVPNITAGGLTFFEIKLPKSEPGINLLRRIRDEAHRFALSYHRLLRKKAFMA